jgi:DnaK suppressor protein
LVFAPGFFLPVTMSQAEKKEYLEKLISEIEKTKRLLESLKEANQPIGPDNALGRMSRMDAINDKSLTDNQVMQNKAKLKKMRKVLDEKDSSAFGHCFNCEKPISIPRLMYMPQSRTCINCA